MTSTNTEPRVARSDLNHGMKSTEGGEEPETLFFQQCLDMDNEPEPPNRESKYVRMSCGIVGVENGLCNPRRMGARTGIATAVASPFFLLLALASCFCGVDCIQAGRRASIAHHLVSPHHPTPIVQHRVFPPHCRNIFVWEAVCPSALTALWEIHPC